MPLVLSRGDVDRVLAEGGAALREALVQRMEAAYREMAEGLVQQHDRIYLRAPLEGVRRPPGLFSMSAMLPRTGVMGTRLHPVAGEGDSSEPLLILYDARRAVCLAIMDDLILHQYRTGTPAALATRHLARPDSRVVACLGSSGIARGTLTMVCHVLPAVESVQVYSPTAAHRVAFAAEMQTRLGVPVTAAASAEDAARVADVVITATNADRPVVADSAIRPGTHLNLLARNEIEMATFRRGRIVTTSTERLLNWDPPWREPLRAEWIHAELGEVLTGQAAGRATPEEITIFVGSAPASMWDVVAAAAFYEQARALGIGTEIGIAS